MAASALFRRLTRKIDAIEKIYVTLRQKYALIPDTNKESWIYEVNIVLRYLSGEQFHPANGIDDFMVIWTDFQKASNQGIPDYNFLDHAIEDRLKQGLQILGRCRRVVRLIDTLKHSFKERFYSPEGPFAAKRLGPLKRSAYETGILPK